MFGINNKSNGVVGMYVTTSVAHKPEARIDLLTFMQIVNNFELEPYSAPFLTYSWIVMSAKFPCVSKRSIVPGIIDLPKFNYEALEENVAGGQGSFGVYW